LNLFAKILSASLDFKAVPIDGLAPAPLNDGFLASDGLFSLLILAAKLGVLVKYLADFSSLL
jgi:hypothetical protein